MTQNIYKTNKIFTTFASFFNNIFIMVKDLFERIQNNKGPLGKWASQAEG